MQKATVDIHRKILKLNNVNPLDYIIKPKKISHYLIVALLPWLISCGGKQRPASSPVATSSEENTTTISPSENISNGELSTNNTTLASTTSTSSTTSPPNLSSPTTSTSVVSTTSTNVVSQKTRFADVKPIFQQRCNLCHGPGKPQPTTDWLDYATSKSRVDNGELFNRIWTLKDDPVRGMPQANATQMTNEERELIKKWIEDGGLE